MMSSRQTAIDPENCGSCANRCPYDCDPATDCCFGQVCSQGQCSLECTGGTCRCDGLVTIKYN